MSLSSPFSARWHRVAGLQPRLVPQLSVQRHQARGQAWWVLSDPLTGRSCRLNRPAYALAGRFDGHTSLQTLWEQRQQQDAEPPSQDEVLELLTRLGEQGLLDAVPSSALAPSQAERAGPSGRGASAMQLAPTGWIWRFSLGNPGRWLQRLAGLQRLLFTRPAGWLWLAAMLWLGLTAWEQAPALAAYALRWGRSPELAWLALLVYPPIKLLHEVAHGLAVRQGGSPVRDAGLTLMMGLPMPWVDASAASAWPQRERRMLVSAIGIMAELAIAAAALAGWLLLVDGTARLAAFATFTVAGLSTLLFNANPLQRLDGYHLLCDALQLPNLAPRSRAWWGDLLKRRLLRLQGLEAMPLAPGERPWLLAYAPLAWLCGGLLAGLTLWWVASVSAGLALALLLPLAWVALLRPAWLLLRELRSAALASSGSARRLRLALGAAAALAAVVLLLPLPHHRVAQAVVWPADDAQLRNEVEGFVIELHAVDGQVVAAGEPVLSLSNPALQAEVERQAARVRGLESEWLQARNAQAAGGDAALGEGERSSKLRAELQAAQAALVRASVRQQGLVVRARSAGQLALPQADDLLGQHLPQGHLLGQVQGGSALRLRAAVPHDQASDLAPRVRAVQVWLAGSGPLQGKARLQQDALAAVERLPSAALSRHHGGELATDPLDETHTRALSPVVLLDVAIDAAPDAATATAVPLAQALQQLGQRAWVRFDLGWSALGWRAAQALQRQWLQQARPQG
jgi:putative peptide zinc metalloprotease protein